MWLFVGKAANNVSASDVVTCIKTKGNIAGDEVFVKSLLTNGISKSVKVEIDVSHFDNINKCEFWPVDVTFRRFNILPIFPLQIFIFLKTTIQLLNILLKLKMN